MMGMIKFTVPLFRQGMGLLQNDDSVVSLIRGLKPRHWRHLSVIVEVSPEGIEQEGASCSR